MLKQFGIYVWHGWCSRHASWSNVFVTLVTISSAWFLFTFLLALLFIYIF